MEYILILIIVAVIFYFTISNRPSRPDGVNPIQTPQPPRPEVIEDSSHLKAELAATQEKLAKLNQELGQLQNKLAFVQGANIQQASLVMDLQEECVKNKQAYDKLLGQKKSSEVRTGHISEQLVGLLPEFPVPIHTLKFFGQPLDYISIDLDSEWISFIEVKSGGSVLSDKQRKIRKMIEDKKVRFFEVRIDDKGVKVK